MTYVILFCRFTLCGNYRYDPRYYLCCNEEVKWRGYWLENYYRDAYGPYYYYTHGTRNDSCCCDETYNSDTHVCICVFVHMYVCMSAVFWICAGVLNIKRVERYLILQNSNKLHSSWEMNLYVSAISKHALFISQTLSAEKYF